MNKKSFEKQLSERLGALSIDEHQRILDYYNELYHEKAEQGLSESDIINSFGSIDEIVAETLAENMASTPTSISAPKQHSADNAKWYKNKTLWTIYLSLFFITIPLTIAVISTVLGLAIAVLSVVLSFVICGVVFTAVSLPYAAYGIVTMFSNFSAGLAQIGVGLALLAVGLVIMVGCWRLYKFTSGCFPKNKAKPTTSKPAANRERNLLRTAAITCVAAISAGVILFTAGLGFAGWDIRKLDTSRYEVFAFEIQEAVTTLDIDVKSRGVEIIRTTNAQNWRVETWQTKGRNCTLEVTFDNGTLVVVDTFNTRNTSFSESLNVFGAVNWRKRQIRIYIPDQVEELNAVVATGTLRLEGFTIGTADIKITTGDIRIRNCTFTTLTTLATTGSTRIINSSAVNLTATSSTGDIRVRNVTVTSLTATASTGTIRVSIKGSRNDYDIKSNVTTGSSNAGNRNRAGDNKIVLTVTTGSIRLSFK
jgi:uncharacterized membrane protein